MDKFLQKEESVHSLQIEVITASFACLLCRNAVPTANCCVQYSVCNTFSLAHYIKRIAYAEETFKQKSIIIQYTRHSYPMMHSRNSEMTRPKKYRDTTHSCT